jgi:hypothetical protein
VIDTVHDPNTHRSRTSVLKVRQWEPIAAGALLLVSFLLRVPTLGQPLVEAFGFRLTFTAFPARVYHREGFDLLHPQVPVLGSPWELPVEFPLYQAIAAVLMHLGLSEVVALRGLSLTFFTLTGWLLFVMASRLTDRLTALLTLVFFLFSPLAFLWSRAALIEFLVTAATLAWVLLAWAWADASQATSSPAGARQHLLLAGAVASGSAALLVKAPSAVWWLLPLLVGIGAGPAHFRRWWSKRDTWPGPPIRGIAALLGIPLLLAALWTRHAQVVKQRTESTSFLASDDAFAWYFGAIGQRLEPQAWGQAMGWMVLAVAGVGGVLSLALLVLARRGLHPTLVAVLLTAPLTVLTFWNQYVVHGYYWAAVAPALALGIATGAMAGIRRLPPSLHSRALVGAVAIWLVTTLVPAWHYVTLPLQEFPADHEAMGMGARLAAVSEPDDQAFIEGLEWDPSILYFADRRGLMLAEGLPPGAPSRQPDLVKYRFMVVLKPGEQPLDTTMVRGWAAPVEPNIYELASDPSELGQHAIRFAGERPIGLEAGRAGEATCGGGVPVQDADAGELWLTVRGNASGRLYVADTLAPVPGDASTVVVSVGRLPAGSVLRCMGDVAITAAEWR